MVSIDKKALLLALAIIDLSLSYVLFTNQQYFSIFSMIGIFVLAFLALAAFLIPKYSHDEGKIKNYLVLIILISVIISLYEIMVDVGLPQFLLPAIKPLVLVSFGAIISIAGIYYTAKYANTNKHRYLTSIAGICVTATLAYLAMYAFSNINWNGVDELAYNYYAATLVLHGHNPYTASMEPILASRHVYPTVQLDGTYEYSYLYPAFSFLSIAFIPLLGITNFLSFIALIIFLSVASSYLIYTKTGSRREVLVPIAVWLLVSYALIGVASPYIAVSFLLLLAYLYRERTVLSSALIGLSASTTQLSWFAIPFFYILMLKESRGKETAKGIMVAAFIFLLVNLPFIVASPRVTLTGIFSIFGLNKLPFYGVNITQFLIAFYPVEMWYAAVVSAVTLLALLLLYYKYTDRLGPLIGIAPMMIFFLAWRNISIYGLSFVPLIIAVYYTQKTEAKGRAPGRIIPAALASLAIFALLLAVYSHGVYENQNYIKMTNITPIVYYSGYSGFYSLGGLIVNVTSNMDAPTNVSFYIVAKAPDQEGYILGSELQQLQPHSSQTYTLNYSLPAVNQNTRLFIVAFSPDYITAKNFNFSRLQEQNG